jgi:hypothetical protein
MTLDHFESLVKEVQPSFRLRYKAFSDIVGLFLGDHYIGYRLNKGELHGDSFYYAEEDGDSAKLLRRGRRGILDLLVRRHLLTRNQASRILYGLSATN